MIIFGLGGGIGNAIFALPTIKRFSRADSVGLSVDCDYDASALFARCSYIKKVYWRGDTLPKASRYLVPYAVPDSMRGRPVEFIGWPRGISDYPHPEWKQIKMKSGAGDAYEDTTDWCEGLRGEKDHDVALIPCGKPGDEWSRKKWPNFFALAKMLEHAGLKIRSFGKSDEIKEARLESYWSGDTKLEKLPDEIHKCRVAISNDCGPGHLASSIGVPTVMIFTATSPIKGQPIGPHRSISIGCKTAPRGCQSTVLWKACSRWTCQNVSPEQVLSHAMELIEKK